MYRTFTSWHSCILICMFFIYSITVGHLALTRTLTGAPLPAWRRRKRPSHRGTGCRPVSTERESACGFQANQQEERASCLVWIRNNQARTRYAACGLVLSPLCSLFTDYRRKNICILCLCVHVGVCGTQEFRSLTITTLV